MAYADWMIRTKMLGACSCDYGCPCEFMAPPTRLPCEGVMAIEITEGYYENVRLDGLRVAGAYRWPGPLHEGNGTWWSIIDKRATEDQVQALFTILGGEEQEPTTGFAIYASTIANEPEPIFADIDFEFDLENCTGSFGVKDILGAKVGPIRNPVTDEPLHISLHLREGFEFRQAEMGSATFWCKGGGLDQSHEKRFVGISYVSYGPHGIIDSESHPNASAP